MDVPAETSNTSCSRSNFVGLEPFGLNPVAGSPGTWTGSGGDIMHGIIYLVGLIVVILAILSFFGLR
jgi:hypothetical protein